MFDRHSRADKICAAGTAITALAAFLPWFRSTDGGITVVANGFRSGLFGDITFLAAAMMVLLLLVRHGLIQTGLGRDLPEGHMFLGSAAVAVVATLVQIMLGDGAGHGVAAGLFLAIAGVAVMAWGGWTQYQDDVSPSRSIAGRTRR